MLLSRFLRTTLPLRGCAPPFVGAASAAIGNARQSAIAAEAAPTKSTPPLSQSYAALGTDDGGAAMRLIRWKGRTLRLAFGLMMLLSWTASAVTDSMVWVNTNSGVYHCPSSQYYGNTKRGKYLSKAKWCRMDIVRPTVSLGHRKWRNKRQHRCVRNLHRASRHQRPGYGSIPARMFITVRARSITAIPSMGDICPSPRRLRAAIGRPMGRDVERGRHADPVFSFVGAGLAAMDSAGKPK